MAREGVGQVNCSYPVKLNMKPQTNPQVKTKLEKLCQPFIEKVAVIGAGLGGLAVAVAQFPYWIVRNPR